MVKDQLLSEVKARFRHYPPRDANEINTHENIRDLCSHLVEDLISILPEGVLKTREFSQVMTDIENAMMHCNAAYARHKPVGSEMNP